MIDSKMDSIYIHAKKKYGDCFDQITFLNRGNGNLKKKKKETHKWSLEQRYNMPAWWCDGPSVVGERLEEWGVVWR